MATIKEKQWKFTIYLVGFPDIKGDPTIIPITAMMETLIPEARVLKHTIFRGGTLRNPKNQDPSNELADPEDGCGPKELDLDDGGGIKDGAKDEEAPGLENVLETTVAELDTLKQNIFLPEWIDSEAMELLGRIERNILREKRSFRHKIVLAGYGFGGIIIKKAVITANSALRFQDLAFTIDSLLFIATPHRSSTQLAWEELLLRMLNATGISYRDRLSEILSGLIRSVSQLSNVFHIFAAKYKITNMIGKECSDEYDPMRFNSTFEEVISRSKTHHEMLCCSIHDVEYLELMRKAFTPRAVHQDISMQNYRLQLDARIDSYAELLERLSPVRWLIYNNRKTEYMEHFETLKQIYQPFLIEAFTKEILGCSVEVVSPNIHGGLTLLKLLCQEIIETSTAVVIESNSSLQIGECSRYNMCMSFIHQIITQRPSLFRPIQSMTTEVLSQNIWTEEVLHLLLYSILIHSNGTHFVVAIYDFESWPLELHSWLSRIQNTISKANGSTLSILTCSRNEITGLPREKTNKIIISPEEHTTLMKAFIHTKVDHFLGENRVSDLAKKELRKRIWKIASPLAQSFDGSFSTMNIYLVQLIRSISLTSVNAIKSAVGSIQVTSEKIYEHCLQELLNKPRKVRFWAYKVLSWLLFTVRPLHIKELAIAVALRLEKLTLKNIRENISIDMDKDIRDYLGPLVRIEDQFVYLDSQKLKDILLCSNGNFLKKAEIIGDRDLARLSIRYLSLIFARAHEKKATWDNCLSKLSNKNQGLSYDEPELHFLEYACRFWPTHLQRGRALDRDTINEVKDFFTQKSDITNMWFRLYLLCHGQRSNPFTEDPERQRAKTQIPDAYDNIGDVADIYEPQSAAEMAGYVGLSDVVPFLLSESETDTFKEITIRRGYWDHKVVIQNTKSMHYLDLIIENADTVDECFSANQKEMSSHFPLHRAVISGCLGATKVLFNFISNHHPILSEVDSDGRTPLHMAALCGSEAVLRFLIDKAVSGKLPGMNTEGDILDAKDYHSETALIAAVRMGNVDAAKILLESGARVNIQDGSGRTALHFAASNCPQLIRSLMDQNNDAAIMADQDGCNPLHIAIKYGSRDGIMILFEAYRRLTCFSQIVSANDNDGKTALHYAAERGFEDITRQLIAPEGMQMANVDDIQRAAELAAINGHLAALRAIIGQEEIRNFGHQILSVAVSAGQLLVVCYLLQNNVSLNEKLNDGNIILSIASSKGFTEIVRILLQHGADVIATDSERRTPLHHAAGHGMYEIAQILLGHQPEHGQLLKIEACDLERYTPLHYAARAGEVKMVEFLLQKNAEIDAQSVKEETPLHVAVKNSTVMRLLIDAGAEVNALDYYGRTPLHLAVSEVEAILQFQSRLQKGPEIPSNDLVSVFKSSALGTAKVLVNQLPEIITRRDANDHTLLHIAAESSEVGMLTLLLDAGSDMSALNKNGETPLFRAAIFNKADNLRLLIKRGGKIDQSRTDGWMILHIAAYLDRTESAVVLLEAGAALNKPAVHQATPLFLAAQQNKAKMVELLLEKGADPNMTATDGWSPSKLISHQITRTNPD
ncbi:hypothetical protein TrVFT333_005422 [Trichoderma virens FT-333]|nr:hypothetical protein TrVFT333_005422 [Trichoderma virens FT-333]